MKKFIHLLLFILSFNTINAQQQNTRLDTLVLNDKTRNRVIPIAIYQSQKKQKKASKLVIISHGYGQNKGGAYLGYSFIAEFLASKGYFVVNIQHELPTDDLIPMEGKPQVVRRPFWDRGADNILFVLQQIKKSHPKLNYKDITLIGHSNGGDMTALFPQKYPNKIQRIITLDNRRMALPLSKSVKVLSLRSSDQPADEGVLPTAEDQTKYTIQLIKLPNTIHNHMDDEATPAQRAEINGYIWEFLNK